jgi:hypothetical protein
MLAQTAGSDWVSLLTGPGALLIALLFVILTGVRRLWVFGWAYEEKAKEADQWREMALRGTTLAEKAVKRDEQDKPEVFPR